ncbi:hypothetical protein ACLB1T_06530 [Escherichia coli]
MIVDEAHSFGVLGATGRGLAELSALKMMWILSLVLSVKVWPRSAVLLSVRKRWEVLRYGSRPYIFTASPSPSCIATVRSSLRTIATQPELRQKLMDNANHLYDGLQKLGYELSSTY